MPRIEQWLRLMKELSASVLHLSAGAVPAVEVFGALVPLPDCEAHADDDLRRLLKEIVPDGEWGDFERGHDATFTYQPGGTPRIHGSLYEHHRGIGAVLRLLPDRAPTLLELKVPPAILGLCHARGGIVLVTGPAGAGKSTLLAALLDGINQAHCRSILTLEERLTLPQKSKKSILVQRQVGTSAWAIEEALRAAPRRDVDVVLVDPLPAPAHRDDAAARVVSALLMAAEAGVLCLVALRARDSLHGIESIIAQCFADQQGQVRRQLGRSLRAVISQRLCQAADGKGVIAAHEILLGGPGLAAAVDAGSTAALLSLVFTGRALGMQSLDRELALLRDGGAITQREADRHLSQRPCPLGFPDALADASADSSTRVSVR